MNILLGSNFNTSTIWIDSIWIWPNSDSAQWILQLLLVTKLIVVALRHILVQYKVIPYKNIE